MLSGGGPGLQSRVGGNRIVPGGFDSHPFRFELIQSGVMRPRLTRFLELKEG